MDSSSRRHAVFSCPQDNRLEIAEVAARREEFLGKPALIATNTEAATGCAD
jgi:hypothetical protein